MDGFPAGAEGDSYAPADDLLWRVMHALAQEDGIGMALVGADLRVTYSSLNPEHFRGLAASRATGSKIWCRKARRLLSQPNCSGY